MVSGKEKNLFSLISDLQFCFLCVPSAPDKFFKFFFISISFFQFLFCFLFYFYLILLFRKYTNGSVLRMHVDTVNTHVVSAIINVDQQLDYEVGVCQSDDVDFYMITACVYVCVSECVCVLVSLSVHLSVGQSVCLFKYLPDYHYPPPCPTIPHPISLTHSLSLAHTYTLFLSHTHSLLLPL